MFHSLSLRCLFHGRPQRFRGWGGDPKKATYTRKNVAERPLHIEKGASTGEKISKKPPDMTKKITEKGVIPTLASPPLPPAGAMVCFENSTIK